MVGCPSATAPFLSAAARLAFTAAANTGSAHRGAAGGVGFHGAVSGSTLPQEVQQALHWQGQGGAAEAATSAVRSVALPYILLTSRLDALFNQLCSTTAGGLVVRVQIRLSPSCINFTHCPVGGQVLHLVKSQNNSRKK